MEIGPFDIHHSNKGKEMTESLQIPDSMKFKFKQLLNRIPEERREDFQVQQMLLVYLKLGGIKLAARYVEGFSAMFPEEIVLLRNKPMVQSVQADESQPAVKEDPPDESA